MRISIVMPYHKGIHFLSDAMESLGRSFEACRNKEVIFELILVFDEGGFGDDTRMLIEKYKNIYGRIRPGGMEIKAVPEKGKRNVAELRNEGVRVSSGEYVYFMDSDDYVMPGTLGVMADRAAAGDRDVIMGRIETSMFKYETCVADYNGQDYEAHDVDRRGERTGKESMPYIYDNVVRNLSEYKLTVLGSLIRKCYMEEKAAKAPGVIFDAENELYPDMAVTARVYSCTDSIDYDGGIVYVKRVHNESILFPSLEQTVKNNRKEIYKKSLAGAMLIEKDELNKRGADKETESGRGRRLIYRSVKMTRKEENRKRLKKRLVQVGNFFRRPTFLYRMIEKAVFRRLGMKDDWILFESFQGRSYSDSCKYIYEYINRHMGGMYKCIWVVNDKHTDIPGNPVKVRYIGPGWFYYTSRAKYYVSNMRQPVWLYRRPESVMLQTWHGTPLKKLVFDMDDIHAATPGYKMDMYAQSRAWNYLISDNPFSTDVFERCFLYPRERILETGYPRNDILYSNDREEKAESIRKKLGIPSGKQVVLYAPTWRDDEYYGPGEYQFALRINLDAMKKKFGGRYVILLRTHYFIADAVGAEGYEGFAYNVSRYDDIAELYLIADVCITDYSSVFFDYANLGRPVLFYVYDFEKYRDKLRGFYIDMEKELPGPLLYTEDELFGALENIEDIFLEYKDRYDVFRERFCCVDDGSASARVVEKVFGINIGR